MDFFNTPCRLFLKIAFIFILVNFHSAVLAQVLQLSESYSLSGRTEFLDAQPELGLQIYRTYSHLAKEDVTVDEDAIGELYLVYESGSAPVFLTQDESLFNAAFYNAWFADNGNSILIASYTGNQYQNRTTHFHLYDIESQQFTSIDSDSNNIHPTMSIHRANKGRVFYFFTDALELFRYEVGSNSMSQLDAPAESDFQSCSHFTTASDVDKLLYFSCDKRLFSKTNNDQWTGSLRDDLSFTSVREPFLSGNGETLVFSPGGQTLNKLNLQDPQAMPETYREGGHGFTRVLAVNEDGSKILANTVLETDFQFRLESVDHHSRFSYLLDTDTGMGAYVGLYNVHLEGEIFYPHVFYGQNLYFSSSHESYGRIVYGVDVNTFLDVPGNAAASDFLVESSEPLTASLTSIDTAYPSLIIRTNAYTLEQNSFVFGTSTYKDEVALDAELHKYQYFACNEFYVCSEQASHIKSVQIRDFATKPVITLSYSADGVAPSEGGRIYIDAETEEEQQVVKIFRHTDPAPGFGGMSHDTDSHDVYWAKFCYRKQFGRDSCGGLSDPFLVDTPLTGIDIAARILADLSGVRVSWPANYGTTYKLFRILDGEIKLIYEGNATAFVDSEMQLLTGNQVMYRVLTCNDVACAHNDSANLLVDRVETPLSIAQTSGATVYGNYLQLSTSYFFDSLEIIRINMRDRTQHVIGPLPGDTSHYLDVISPKSENWDYQLKGCYRDICLFSGMESFGHALLAAPELPSTPTNLRFNKERWYTAGEISWDPVSSADGYRITVEPVNIDVYNNELRARRQWSVDKDTNSLTYVYGANFGKTARVSVQSYILDENAGNNHYFSRAAEMQVELNQQLPLPQQLASHAFEVYRNYHGEGEHSTTLNLTKRASFDRYFAHVKSESDTDFVVYPMDVAHRGGRTFRHVYRTDSDEAVEFTYKVSACNDYLERCVWLDGEPRVAFQPEADLTTITTGPTVTAGEQGQIIVSPDFPSGLTFQYLNVQVSKGSTFRDVYEGPVLESFDYISRDFFYDKNYSFRTKLCRIIRSSGSGFQGFDCTDYSEASDFELPDDFIMSPQSNTSVITELLTGSDGSQLIQLSSSDYRFDDNSDIDYPDTVKIFRGVNNNTLELLTEVDFPTNLDGNPNEDVYRDTDILPGTLYRYRIQYCNRAGCGEFSDINHRLVPANITVSTPDIPEINLFEDNHLSFVYQLQFRLPELVDFIDVKWSDVGPDDLYRDFGLTLREYLRTAGVFRISRLLRSEDLWISARACNGDTCSDWSEVEHFAGESHIETDLALSGEGFLNMSIRSDIALQGYKNQVKARYGRFYTYSGELAYDRWTKIAANTHFYSTIYLVPHWGNECATLFSQGLKLPTRQQSEGSFVSDLVRVLHTGNGCADRPDLEPSSYYIDSDYLSAPILIDDKDLLERQWLDLSVTFDTDSSFTIKINELDALTFSSNINFPGDVFKLALLSWKTLHGNAMSAVSVASEDLPDNINIGITARSGLDINQRFHPEALALLSARNNEVFDLNVWVAESAQIEFEERYSFDGNGQIEIIDDLTQGDGLYVLYNRCNSEQCSPYEAEWIDLPEFSSLSNWSSLVRDAQSALNQLNLSLRVGSGFAQTISVYRKFENGDSYAEVLNMPFVEALRQHASLSTFPDSFSFTDTGLEPEYNYQYYTRVCNPLGCLDTDAVTFEVPKDSDGDGVIDENDAFPEDPDEWSDTDGDGVGNNVDEDDDNDGIPDEVEQQIGLDPLNSLDALLDTDGDGYSNLMEYLAGTGLSNGQKNPSDVGRFYSFENGIEPELNIEGSIEIAQLHGWHGNARLASQPLERRISVTIPGSIAPGRVYFAVRDLSESHTVLAKLDDGTVELGEPLIEPVLRPFAWHVYSFFVENPAEKLELTFTFDASHSTGLFSLDGIFLPRDVTSSTAMDYTGDGKADLALRDAPNTLTHILSLEDDLFTSTRFGLQATDIPVSGDFDGDGKADIAVRRPSNSMWYVKRSSDGEIGRQRFGLQEGDIPVPADYDGDGTTDFAVRRPGNQMWYILRSSDAVIERHHFGRQAEDIPVPADYDGDGKADIAVRRPSNQHWYILRSSDGEIERHHFGRRAEDIPVPADYDGDGKADVAVRRPSARMWYIKQSSDGQIQRIRFGLQEEDIPVVADYNGDGKAQVAVRRPSTHFWYILKVSDGTIIRSDFGSEPEFIPVAAPVMLRMAMVSALSSGVQPTVQDLTKELQKSQTDIDYYQEIYRLTIELTGTEQ